MSEFASPAGGVHPEPSRRVTTDYDAHAIELLEGLEP